MRSPVKIGYHKGVSHGHDRLMISEHRAFVGPRTTVPQPGAGRPPDGGSLLSSEITRLLEPTPHGQSGFHFHHLGQLPT